MGSVPLMRDRHSSIGTLEQIDNESPLGSIVPSVDDMKHDLGVIARGQSRRRARALESIQVTMGQLLIFLSHCCCLSI